MQATLRRLLIPCCWLLGCLPGSAEDFTGAYAGINAGYARSVGERGAVVPSLDRPGGAAGSGNALPPSAVRAIGTSGKFDDLAKPGRR